MARLIVNPRTPQARPLLLKQGVNKLGRREGNDFTIDDPSVSGSHCEVIVSDGTARLRDLGSTNGTFINGVQVTDVALEADQHIQLGNVIVLFEADAPASARVAAVPPPPPPPPPGVRIAAAPPTAPAVRISLSAAAHVPAPAVVEVPAADEEPSTIALPPNTRCKYHPNAFARWACTGCGKAYCDLCVSPRTTAAGSQMFCRSCGAVAARAHVEIDAPQEKTFFRELPRAIAYPFRGKGVMILIFATIAFALLDFISRGLFSIITKAAALGYFFSFAQNIINSTAIDEDEPPDLPGLDDVFGGFFRLLGVTLVSFGPALVVAYFAIFQEQPAAGVALIPAVIFGCLYFPMAFLAVAINDDVMSCNPLVVVPSILKVPLEYIITVLLVGGVFGIRWLGTAVSSGLVGPSLFTTSMSTMFLLFGLRALWAFISVYLLTVTMRILGVLYVTKKHKLGW
jgi:hypothetical protein